MGLDIEPHRRAADAKGFKSLFQPGRRDKEVLSKVELPEGEECHDADRDQQLRQEDGVDLWEEEHAVRTALLTGRVFSVSGAVVPS